MNTLLWIVQAVIAAVFTYSGINKSIFSEQKLVASGQTGVEGLPPLLIRFIGISEILGAIGIFLPLLLHIFPLLTSISAVCLSVIMLLAANIHFKRREYKNVLTNCILFLLCIFVAYYRFHTN